jgi:molybdate transport system ATP-binding protein
MSRFLRMSCHKHYQNSRAITASRTSFELQAQADFPLDPGEVTVLFGPSGCGKTTWLRCLAGLEQPQSGEITYAQEVWFDAARKISLSPAQRGIGFLPQNYALFPHLTVADNVGYGLTKLNISARQQRVREYLTRFQLTEFSSRYPHQLSGGQQQRVALARALILQPRLLLLDEPLSALDALLRDELRQELRKLLAQLHIPTLIVTHDRLEAMSLGHKMIVLDQGKILQHGPVSEIFTHPANVRVAQIVGMESILAGEIIDLQEGLATIDVQGTRLYAPAAEKMERQVYICIKGEDVTLQNPVSQIQASSVRNHIPCTVTALIPEGPLIRVGLHTNFDFVALITRPAAKELALEVGKPIVASIKATAIHLLPR